MNERAADISRVLVASAWLDRWADITVRAIAPSQTGGTTSSTIRVITDTGVLRLKLFDDPGLVAAMPDVAAGEAHAMGCARNVLDSLVPQVVTVAPVGVEGLPPGVLMTELPGEPRTDASSIGPAVTALARLHESIPDERLPDLYPPWADLDHATVPSWATRPDCWHDLLRLISDGPQAEPNVFIHRDAQPANLLWVDDALTGIVDWTFACRGPASADLAHLRVNVVLVDGLEPASRISPTTSAAARSTCRTRGGTQSSSSLSQRAPAGSSMPSPSAELDWTINHCTDAARPSLKRSPEPDHRQRACSRAVTGGARAGHCRATAAPRCVP